MAGTYKLQWTPRTLIAAGAIPFLPNNDILVSRLEKQWGDLNSYQGIR